MRNYALILKLLIKDVLKRREKKHIILFALVGFLYLAIMSAGVFMMIFLAPSFKAVGAEAEFITAILLVDFIATIFLGTVSAISYLYLSKDNEFFLTLPVKPMSVFLAKLSMVYLTELILSVALLLPLLITTGVVMGMSALFFIMIPVAILAVPVFSMIIIAIISMPLVFFITLFKSRGAITSIIVIVIFGVAFALYYSVVLGATSHTGSGEADDISAALNSLTKIAYIFYPMYMLIKFASLKTVFSLPLLSSMLIEITLFIAILVALFALSLIISLAFYRRINSKVLENSGFKTSKKGTHSFGSPFKAIIKKEWKEIFRNPTVALQALLGIVFCPIIMIALPLNFKNAFSVVENPEMTAEMIKAMTMALIWSTGIMVLMSLGVGINVGSNTCISREGKCFHILKMLPVDYKTQIKAKHTLYAIIGLSTVITGFTAFTIITILLDMFLWWAALMLLASAVVWVYAISAVSIYLDLKNPRLDWKNVKEILKRGKNSAISLIWIFGSMACGILIMIFSVVMIDSAFLILGAGLGIFILLGITMDIVFYNLLYNNVEKLFYEIER